MDVMHADLERKLLAVFLLLASIIIVKCVSIEIAKTFNGIGLILTFFSQCSIDCGAKNSNFIQ